MDKEAFDQRFLIGLDLILIFKLCRNENLIIFQKLYSKGNTYFPRNKFVELQADLRPLSHQKLHDIERIIKDFNTLLQLNSI